MNFPPIEIALGFLDFGLPGDALATLDDLPLVDQVRPDALAVRIECLLACGHVADAVTVARKASLLHPDGAGVLYAVALAYSACGDVPAAIQALHGCFRHAPDLRLVALDDARLDPVWQRIGTAGHELQFV